MTSRMLTSQSMYRAACAKTALLLLLSGAGVFAQAPERPVVPNQLQPGAATQPPGEPASVSLTFAGALQRAGQLAQSVYTAAIGAQLAHEDAVQAKAALLPNVTWLNQFIYTQPNGSDTGVFVANNGPREYMHEVTVHADVYAPGKLADYHRALAAEAVARARAEIATRGLIAVVVQNYYGMAIAQRKLATAQQSLQEAENFADITRKQEQGGEAAHADVVKAEIQVEQRRADLRNAQLDLEKARIALGVIIFPNYGQAFSLADDLDRVSPLPPFADIQAMASRNSPDLRAAQAAVAEQTHELRSNRAAFYPTVGFDYFYGLDANRYAVHTPEGYNQLGSVVQATVTVPVWNWGATRSRVRQSELRLQLARNDLTLTQRQLLGNLNSFYAEAGAASALLDSLRRTVDLAAESLRLTILRYQAGEATALEVVDAQTTAAQARNAYLDGLLRLRLAIANLQTLTGAF